MASEIPSLLSEVFTPRCDAEVGPSTAEPSACFGSKASEDILLGVSYAGGRAKLLNCSSNSPSVVWLWKSAYAWPMDLLPIHLQSSTSLPCPCRDDVYVSTIFRLRKITGTACKYTWVWKYHKNSYGKGNRADSMWMAWNLSACMGPMEGSMWVLSEEPMDSSKPLVSVQLAHIPVWQILGSKILVCEICTLEITKLPSGWI